MNHQLNPDDPAFREAVIAVVDSRLGDVDRRIRDVVACIGTQLHNAGYTEAAGFVLRNFGG
jgi:hypothetical protein